jgi:hypothetical protein
MSDWIDELRLRRDSAMKRNEQPDSVWQSDVELTKAKSPAFWRELMDQLKKDINKLNQVFADDDKYQAHITQLNQNVFEISNWVCPYKTIVGILNETNLFADLEIWTGVDEERFAEKISKEIKFGLANKRDLYALYMGTNHSFPTSLSKALLHELLGLDV